MNCQADNKTVRPRSRCAFAKAMMIMLMTSYFEEVTRQSKARFIKAANLLNVQLRKNQTLVLQIVFHVTHDNYVNREITFFTSIIDNWS